MAKYLIYLVNSSKLASASKKTYITLMSEYKHRRHNVSVLLYYLVCPAKYRTMIFTEDVEVHLIEVCKAISERYEKDFLEIEVDMNHVHFLIQSVPKYSPTMLPQTVKSKLAREIFRRVAEVKEEENSGRKDIT